MPPEEVGAAVAVEAVEVKFIAVKFEGGNVVEEGAGEEFSQVGEVAHLGEVAPDKGALAEEVAGAGDGHDGGPDECDEGEAEATGVAESIEFVAMHEAEQAAGGR